MLKTVILFSFVSISFLFGEECAQYTCLPSVDSFGNQTENTVETQTSYSNDYHYTTSGTGSSLPESESFISTCTDSTFQQITRTYYIYSTSGEQNDVWANETQLTHTCHRTDLSHVYDPDTDSVRPINQSDCSSSQYFDGSTCQNADCPLGQIPDDDYITSNSCHDAPSPEDNNTTDPTNNDNTDNNNTTDPTNTDNTVTDNTSNDYNDVLSQINSSINEGDLQIKNSLDGIQSEIIISSDRNHQDLSAISSQLDQSNAHLSNLNSQISDINQFMQSEMDNTEAADHISNAKNQATSTVNSITSSLNSIISSYTGTLPIVTGTGNHTFTTTIYGSTIEFDLSMFENLRSYFDILWLLMLAYFNFKMYVLIIRDLLKKF